MTPVDEVGSYGVMVSTLDFESSDPSSNLGGTLHFFLHLSMRKMGIVYVAGQFHFRRYLWSLCDLQLICIARGDPAAVRSCGNFPFSWIGYVTE